MPKVNSSIFDTAMAKEIAYQEEANRSAQNVNVNKISIAFVLFNSTFKQPKSK
jgi:hypothetical protein